jgi:hypothetical protein
VSISGTNLGTARISLAFNDLEGDESLTASRSCVQFPLFTLGYGMHGG